MSHEKMLRDHDAKWTIETALCHLENTGTHEQRKCVRIVRRLLEVERACRLANEAELRRADALTGELRARISDLETTQSAGAPQQHLDPETPVNWDRGQLGH